MPQDKNNIKTQDFADIAQMSFEQAMADLEKIVRDIETGQSSLEDSINAYERGIALKQHCAAKLKDAQTKIEKITIDSQGNIASQPADDIAS